ncbi:ABC transporter permease [Trichloromonas sp.]|uniref:ABC transporter permease n=1 Tax=Trichloromonas sp. TaxID=3069249 RepID=UPI002A47081C|nr:ABC transporter permease [Trichloromonas sp.]
MRGKLWSTLTAYALAAVLLLMLSHALLRLLPGDFVSAHWERGDALLDADQAAALRERFGTEESFSGYLSALARGDWGCSLALEKPVLDLITEALPWTLLLMGSAHLLATALGFIAGMEVAWRRGSPLEKGSVAVMSLLDGVPELVSGLLLLLFFSLRLEWLPASGAQTAYAELAGGAWFADLLRHLALPLLTLVLADLPGNFLLARGSMLLVLDAPYLETAQAKGLPPWRVRYRHGARNALLPLVTRFGLRFSLMVTGALVVETLFAYPGLARLLVEAVGRRDLPLARGIILFSSLAVLVLNLGVELLYRRLDPRVCHGH